MDTRSTPTSLGFLLVAVFLILVPNCNVQAGSPPLESIDSTYEEAMEKAKEGKKGRFTGTRYYWDEGFHIVSRRENFRLKIGGKIILHGGYIEADKELESAFPDLEGYGGDFRTLSVDFSGTIRVLSAVKDRVESIEKPAPRVVDGVISYAPYSALDFKLDIDFANVREINDIWIRFPRIPLLGYLTLGHMKEPFSLERQTSINNTTFMEQALPNEAFDPSRNIGIMFGKPVLNERMTLAGGGF